MKPLVTGVLPLSHHFNPSLHHSSSSSGVIRPARKGSERHLKKCVAIYLAEKTCYRIGVSSSSIRKSSVCTAFSVSMSISQLHQTPCSTRGFHDHKISGAIIFLSTNMCRYLNTRHVQHILLLLEKRVSVLASTVLQNQLLNTSKS